MKYFSANDLFGYELIGEAIGKSHRELIELVQPNMDRINELTGQENSVEYMAYVLEYAANQLEKSEGEDK